MPQQTANRASPWANKSVAPLQAAGALIPLVDTGAGVVFGTQLHGTAFFISEGGLFLTAAHVVEDFPNVGPPLVVAIVNVHGLTTMPVAWVMRHPTADVAVGLAVVREDQPAKVSPLTLSTRRLQAGEHVAVLGYPRTSTRHAVSPEGEALSQLSFTPDYYEGDILEHHPNGISLARWPAYSTDIVPPPSLKDFSGMSGGPLVTAENVHVHGLLCSASEGYALCTDVQTVLDWEVFQRDAHGVMTVCQLDPQYVGVIRVV